MRRDWGETMVAEEEETKAQPPLREDRATKTGGNALRVVAILAVAGALVIGYLIWAGITARAKANQALERQTLDNAIETVAVVKPQPSEGAEEVVLPGNMQAFIDTPIWARASGYLKVWHVDIGARVKRGELLAEIESPEVDQQLAQAKATLAVASANLKLAQVTAERYNNLFKTDSVSKQDVDNAVQDAAAKTASVNADQANVARLEQMVSYEKVFAPFDGVITARNVDVGALVDADANAPGKELFHLASNATLRVYVSVPEVYSRAAKPGVSAFLTLTEYPGRRFHGTIVRNANAIDTSSRTLLVEVDVKNPTGELLPGSYASVHLKLPEKVQALTVPANALLFRSAGLQVATVSNGTVKLVPVVLGHDYGDTVEILSGVRKDDAVVVNPSDSIVSGEKVRVRNSSAGNE
ncbi:MAG TPA: efflux RND transporter periplasmic adaptor subunit [Bryobacteraceae bacterium]|nr:efflux RND transporter periplasmic adaptor subunit [Bryobacteraceae bacterium]